MTFYAGITDGELRQVQHHIDATLNALRLAQHFAGGSPTLVAEIDQASQRILMQKMSILGARQNARLVATLTADPAKP